MSSKQRRRRAARSAGVARSVDAEKAAELTRSIPPRAGRTAPGEYQSRDLSGAGSSQLSPVRALRARDLNRPTADDLAEAEADLVIVRRHWQPEN